MTMNEPPRYWGPAPAPHQLGADGVGPRLIRALASLPACRSQLPELPALDDMRSWYESLSPRDQDLFSYYKEYGRHLDLDDTALPIVLDINDGEQRERAAQAVWTRFPGAHIIERKRGTVGVVWILENRVGTPSTFAVKMPDPQAMSEGLVRISALSQRELRLWSLLPPHINVMPALGFEFLNPSDAPEDRLPMVWMPHATTSLTPLLGTFAELWERLWVLAQFLEGLAWVYENDFEGHGDLKPDNVLLTKDYYGRFSEFPAGDPRAHSQWRVQVSDFGWADAWRDLDEFRKASRPYLAPERLDNSFSPQLSDMFSVGVIACEVLTGRHPYGGETAQVAKRLRSDSRWRRWVDVGARRLEDVPEKLRGAVEACLRYDPAERPALDEFQKVICEAAKQIGPDPSVALRVHTEHARSQRSYSARHCVDVTLRLAVLGPEVVAKELVRLRRRFPRPNVEMAPEALASSLVGWWGIAKLLTSSVSPSDRDEGKAIARGLSDVAVASKSRLDMRSAWYGWEPKDELQIDSVDDFLRSARALQQTQ